MGLNNPQSTPTKEKASNGDDPENPLKTLYDNVSPVVDDIPDYETFRDKLTEDRAARKTFFDNLKKSGKVDDLPDNFSTFESKLFRIEDSPADKQFQAGDEKPTTENVLSSIIGFEDEIAQERREREQADERVEEANTGMSVRFNMRRNQRIGNLKDEIEELQLEYEDARQKAKEEGEPMHASIPGEEDPPNLPDPQLQAKAQRIKEKRDKKANRLSKIKQQSLDLQDTGQSATESAINTFVRGTLKPLSSQLLKSASNTIQLMKPAIRNTQGFSPLTSMVMNPRQKIKAAAEADPTEADLYEAGEQVSQTIEETFPENPKFRNSFWLKTLPHAAGFAASTTVGGGGTRALGLGAGAGGSIIGSAATASMEFENALERTDDPEKAYDAFLWNLPVGASEGLLPARFFSKFNKGTGGAAAETLEKWVKSEGNKLAAKTATEKAGAVGGDFLKGGATEFMQEATQNYFTNLGAQNIYDETRNLFENVMQEGAAGFLIGSFLNGTASALAQARQNAEGRRLEEIRKAEKFINQQQQKFARGDLPVTAEQAQGAGEVQPQIDFSFDPTAPVEQQLEKLRSERARLNDEVADMDSDDPATADYNMAVAQIDDIISQKQAELEGDEPAQSGEQTQPDQPDTPETPLTAADLNEGDVVGGLGTMEDADAEPRRIESTDQDAAGNRYVKFEGSDNFVPADEVVMESESQPEEETQGETTEEETPTPNLEQADLTDQEQPILENKYVANVDQPSAEDVQRALFDEAVGQKQRAEPESAMRKVQRANGGGVLNPVVEHLGDLTHRMSEGTTAEGRGYENVKSKVDRVLSSLKHDYGFQKEMEENFRNNARVSEKSEQEIREEVDQALAEYAETHAEIPVFNEMQELARDAAIDVGNKRFDEAIQKLETLKQELDKGREHWEQRANEITNVPEGYQNILGQIQGEQSSQAEAEQQAAEETETTEQQPTENTPYPNVSEDAQGFLEGVDATGVYPPSITSRLTQLAEENDIEVTEDTTPEQVIQELKTKGANLSSPPIGKPVNPAKLREADEVPYQKGLAIAGRDRQTGRVYVGGASHSQLINQFSDEIDTGRTEMGFYTEDGQFLTREQATQWRNQQEEGAGTREAAGDSDLYFSESRNQQEPEAEPEGDQQVTPGMLVQWNQEGETQFDEPRRIREIERDQNTGRQYARLDESGEGISEDAVSLLNEIEESDNPSEEASNRREELVSAAEDAGIDNIGDRSTNDIINELRRQERISSGRWLPVSQLETVDPSPTQSEESLEAQVKYASSISDLSAELASNNYDEASQAAEVAAGFALDNGATSYEGFYAMTSEAIDGKPNPQALRKGWEIADTNPANRRKKRINRGEGSLYQRFNEGLASMQYRFFKQVHNKEHAATAFENQLADLYNDPNRFKYENVDQSISTFIKMMPQRLANIWDEYINVRKSYSAMNKVVKEAFARDINMVDFREVASLYEDLAEARKAGDVGIAEEIEQEIEEFMQQDELQQFLIARHAPEANEFAQEKFSEEIEVLEDQISDLEEKVPNLRGQNRVAAQDRLDDLRVRLQSRRHPLRMTTEEANQILDNFRQQEGTGEATKYDDLMHVAEKVWEMNDAYLDEAVDIGVIPAEAAERMREVYDYHIPANRIITDSYGNITGGIVPGVVDGSAKIYEREGSDRHIGSILTNIAYNFDKMFRYGLKNELRVKTAEIIREENARGNSRFGIIKDNPAPDDLAVPFREVQQREVPQDDGSTETEHVIQERHLVFADQEMFDLYNDMSNSPVESGVGAGMIRAIMNLQHLTIIGGTLTFGARNQPRDLSDAMHNALGELGFRDVFKMPKELFAGNKDTNVSNFQDFMKEKVVPYHQAILRYEMTGETGSQAGEDYRRLKEMGGITTFYQIRSRTQLQDGIMQNIAELQDLNQKKPSKNILSRGLKKMGNGIDHWNAMWENSLRTVLFRTGLDSGMTEDQAAEFALETMPNFNQKGETTEWLDKHFLFVGAAEAATASHALAWKKTFGKGGAGSVAKKLGSRMISGAAGWALMGYFNAMFNDAVDDDNYEKDKRLNPWKYHKHVVMNDYDENGDIHQYRMPVGYGTSVYWGLGGDLYDLQQGYIGEEDFTRRSMTNLVDVYNPFSGSDPFKSTENAIYAMTPTWAKPIGSMATNQKFMGELYSEWKLASPQTEDWQLYSPYTPKPFRYASHWLNKNVDTPWDLESVSPKTLELFWGWATNTAGKDVAGFKEFYDAFATGEEFNADKVPILRGFYEDMTKAKLNYNSLWGRLMNYTDDAPPAGSEEMEELAETIENEYQSIKESNTMPDYQIESLEGGIKSYLDFLQDRRAIEDAKKHFDTRGWDGSDNRQKRYKYYHRQNYKSKNYGSRYQFKNGNIGRAPSSRQAYTMDVIRSIEGQYEDPPFNITFEPKDY